MLHAQGFSRNCTLLAVLCGKLDGKVDESKKHVSPPLPKLTSSGRLEVHTLINPSVDKFKEVHKSLDPNFLYIQGEPLENEERIGSIVLEGKDLSDPMEFGVLIGPSMPSMVYLEVPNSQRLAEALHSKGIPFVIYWKNDFSLYGASHFRQALVSVVQSSCSHMWDAFQLAYASFRLYCTRNGNEMPVHNQKFIGKSGLCLLGDAPKINIPPPEKIPGEEEEEEGLSDNLPAIKIYDDKVTTKFLICGWPCTQDECLSCYLEDGLNALLNIEIRGSKLHNRVSATPPPLQAGTFSRGVITMRCDLTTCNSAHVSLLVSGSAQTCFDDQLLESHIKKELTENCQLVQVITDSYEKKQNFSDPRKSSSVACGSSVFEVCLKVPTWASQVLKQLASEVSYRSLVSLGVASIQGLSVASFEKEDAQWLFFCCRRQGERLNEERVLHSPPIWLNPPAPTRKRSLSDHRSNPNPHRMLDVKAQNAFEGRNPSRKPIKKRINVSALKPVPHVKQHKMLPFTGAHDIIGYDGNHVKPSLPVATSARRTPPAPVTNKKSASNSFHAQQIISLNPLPLKKHGCKRPPIQVCPEEEFLRDVMEFLVFRGHTRLVPQGGLSEFPDAILNAKRLDLYNLYREVVTRGGFHVGNGINWKGQVFSKMRNHTVTNRMTGVGNTLKRHYETYLLEYELAHDDVDGECCLLCHSSAPGDWVNCGLCGEWAHFGCDRRQGLGAFKDYAKTDGLEYVCPHCSLSNYKRKSPKLVNGYQQGSASSRLV